MNSADFELLRKPYPILSLDSSEELASSQFHSHQVRPGANPRFSFTYSHVSLIPTPSKNLGFYQAQ